MGNERGFPRGKDEAGAHRAQLAKTFAQMGFRPTDKVEAADEADEDEKPAAPEKKKKAEKKEEPEAAEEKKDEEAEEAGEAEESKAPEKKAPPKPKLSVKEAIALLKKKLGRMQTISSEPPAVVFCEGEENPKGCYDFKVDVKGKGAWSYVVDGVTGKILSMGPLTQQ